MMHSLKTVVVVAGVAACLVGAGVPAAAQSAEGEPDRVIPGLVFTPSIAMGAVHDDNPVLASTLEQPPDDFVSTVRPGVDLTFTAKHAFFGGGYRGSMQRYRTLDAYDSYEQGGHAEYRHQLSRRLSLFARDSFSLSPTTDLVEVAGVPFTRTGTTQNTLNSGLTIEAAKHLQLSVQYDLQWLHFNRSEEPVSALLQGGTAHSVTFGVRRAVTPRFKLGGDYMVQRAIVGEQLVRERFTIQNAEAVATYRISPTVTIEGGGGISSLALPGEGGTHVGPAGRFDLRKRTEYALYTVSAMRSFVPGFGFGGSIRNQELAAGVRVPFARRRAYVEGSVTWRESEPVLQRELRLKALWLQTTVGYSFQRWLRVEGFYNGAFQDTTIAGGRIDRNRIGVQAVTGYPMRLR